MSKITKNQYEFALARIEEFLPLYREKLSKIFLYIGNNHTFAHYLLNQNI